MNKGPILPVHGSRVGVPTPQVPISCFCGVVNLTGRRSHRNTCVSKARALSCERAISVAMVTRAGVGCVTRCVLVKSGGVGVVGGLGPGCVCVCVCVCVFVWVCGCVWLWVQMWTEVDVGVRACVDVCAGVRAGVCVDECGAGQPGCDTESHVTPTSRETHRGCSVRAHPSPATPVVVAGNEACVFLVNCIVSARQGSRRMRRALRALWLLHALRSYASQCVASDSPLTSSVRLSREMCQRFAIQPLHRTKPTHHLHHQAFSPLASVCATGFCGKTSKCCSQWRRRKGEARREAHCGAQASAIPQKRRRRVHRA